MAEDTDLMAKLVSLAKRRGYIFQSSEIYEGIASCYDYGPLGVEMKNNIKKYWWDTMVRERDDMVGLDSSILMSPLVWEASGHISSFTDPLVDCKKCRKRFKADAFLPMFHGASKNEKGLRNLARNMFHPLMKEMEEQAHGHDPIEKTIAGALDADELHVIEELIEGEKGKDRLRCPECGGELTEPRLFNMMFKTFMGPVENDAAVTYLRPETAQGIFVNFQNVATTARMRPPFGIAQIGKAFRNEITPGNFIFRTREFEMMEIEYFVPPDDDAKWFDYWREARYEWHKSLGIREENLRREDHPEDKLAHYAKACTDVEYRFPFGWSELEGVANRTDFDLKQHAEHSGKDMRFFDDQRPKEDQRYYPYVIEPSLGVDRCMLAVLCDAYDEDEAGGENRVVLRLHPRLAPVTVGIFPLVKKDGMPETARKIEEELKRDFNVFYDQGGAIGRRYRRQDEAGTPFCVTVDGQTAEDETVTVRFRDSMEQKRVKIAALKETITNDVKNYEIFKR